MRRLQPNLFSDSNALYQTAESGIAYFAASFTSDWQTESPYTLSVTDEQFFRGDRFSLKIATSTIATAVISTTEYGIKQPDASYVLGFNAMIYCDSKLTVSTYMHLASKPYTSVEPNTQTVPAGSWSAIFSNEGKLSQDDVGTIDLSVTIIITNPTTRAIYLTCPNLTDAEPDKFNPFVQLGKQYLPDIFKEVDDTQENPKRPLLKIFHALTENAARVMDEYIAINQNSADETSIKLELRDSPQNTQSRSTLTDIELMDPTYMKYMSMFGGLELRTGVYLSYKIGDTGPAGGKIFITPSTDGNPTGKYFEAAPSGSPDLQRAWATNTNSNQTTVVSGADGTAIGKGAQNTIDIVAQTGNVAATSAAAYCSDYSSNGFSDWFLPSQNEIYELYRHRTIVGGFTSSNYWSSSEISSTNARRQSFTDGTTSSTSKSTTGYVRPVRSFTAGNIVADENLDFQRWQMQTKTFGHSSGSRVSMKNAVKLVLEESQGVVVSSVWQGDPWAIHVRTLTSETPSATNDGDVSPEVLEMANLSKPAGYVITHETVDEFSFILNEPEFGVFDQNDLGA